MTKYITILLTILYLLEAKSQEKHILVQIDTLISFDDYEEYINFDFIVTNQGFANVGDEYSNTSFYPVYEVPIVIKTDSSQLRIPLDSKGGYLEIYNLYHCNIDTIKIDKYTLYSNCNIDSVYTEMIYHDKDTFLINHEKSYKTWYTEPLPCKRQPPEIIHLRINGIKYVLPVNFQTEQQVMSMSYNGIVKSFFGKVKEKTYRHETHYYWSNSVKVELVR